MSHRLVRFGALTAATLAALVGLAQAMGGSGQSHARSTAATCGSRVTQIAHGQGSPDDLAWDGRSLLVSDLNGGTIDIVAHGHSRTLVRGLSAPEGIVPGPGHSLIVAAQGTNSVVRVRLPDGKQRTLVRLPLPKGMEGIDGIDANGPESVYVPDSARARLYSLRLATAKLTLIAAGHGLIRPVAAINWHGHPVIADEYTNAVWTVGRNGIAVKLAHVPLPDDLAVVSGHLIANSLVGQIWEVAPHLRMLSSAFMPTATDPQGLVADGPDAVLIADQGRNGIYRLSNLAGCL